MISANGLYQWFNQTIYFFHVPLFFVCSGYLYQKLNVINDIYDWKKNIKKKLLVLGVPYFTFSIITWILKNLFSSSVNNQMGDLGDVLFFHPTAPYWYLYALFFLFLITPTFRNGNDAIVGGAVALLLKTFTFFSQEYGIRVISYILSNEIWFVMGMLLCVLDFKKYIAKKRIFFSIIAGAIFWGLSVWIYKAGIQNALINFLLGVIACCTIIVLVIQIYENRQQSAVFEILSKYTMPIFLMHTIFAASMRSILFKLGIQNAMPHVILGIVISFVGPMIAAVIMNKTIWLEFFLYPGKFIKFK